MSVKTIGMIVLGLGLMAAGAAAVVVNVQRATVARAEAEKAASIEAKAEAEKKTAAKQAEAEADRRRAAEAQAKAKADELAAAKIAKEQAEVERETAQARQKTAEAEAAQRKAESETASANRAAELEKAKAARDLREKAAKEAEAEAARAQTAADELAREKLKSEKTIAEAKILEIQKTDFAAWQRDLLELKQDLDERERALTPEKTIADLAWAGGVEDAVMGEDGVVRKQPKQAYDPEKDRTLPPESRRLARAERLAREAFQAEADKCRAKVLAELEPLYVAAVRENRVIDIEFYRQSIQSLYPDWEYKGEGEKKEEDKK